MNPGAGKLLAKQIEPGFQRFDVIHVRVKCAASEKPAAYAASATDMIVRAFETGQNPAVYLRNLRSYDGMAGLLTKAAGSGNFASRPALWTIAGGKPALLNQ